MILESENIRKAYREATCEDVKLALQNLFPTLKLGNILPEMGLISVDDGSIVLTAKSTDGLTWHLLKFKSTGDIVRMGHIPRRTFPFWKFDFDGSIMIEGKDYSL